MSTEFREWLFGQSWYYIDYQGWCLKIEIEIYGYNKTSGTSNV